MTPYRVFLIVLVWCGMGGPVHPSQGTAGDIPTTVGLDLDTVYLEVASPPELKDQLEAQARNHFENHDIPPPATKSLARHRGLLQLHVTAEPIGEMCPDALLYEPMLTLTEAVLVPRKNQPIRALTWSSQAPPHTIEKAKALQVMEADGIEFIEKFIGYNRLSRAAYPEYYLGHPTRPLQGENKLSSPMPSPERFAPNDRASLEGLKMDEVKFFAWAGKYTRQIGSLARHLAQEEGLVLVPNLSGPINKELDLRLHTWPAQTACPHVLIYEATLTLSEQVQIKRNGLSFWTGTWSRRKLSVVKAVDFEQLQSDGNALMAEFISDYKAANPRP